MSTNRKTAIAVGVLFIIGTVAGILSVVLTDEIFSDPNYLVAIAGSTNQVIAGALAVFSMGLALSMIPMLMFPILKEQNETLALGYVIFRGALEMVIYLAMVVSWLLLVVLSREYVAVGMPDGSLFSILGTLLTQVENQLNNVLMIIFPVGAMLYNALLFRSKLVPRWLSAWGFIGVTLHLIQGLLTMFGVLPSWGEMALTLPIAVQEMVFALWLIVKGFNRSSSVLTQSKS